MSVSLSPRHRLGTGMLLVAVLVVAAVASVVAWQRSGADDDVAGSSGISGVASTVPADSPPPLQNTGEDWDAIVRSIFGYQAWLFTHPRPELLENIMLPSYEDFDQHRLGLSNLATKGWRYEPQFRPATVEVVRLHDRPRPDLAVVFVRSFHPPNRIVDPSGAVIVDSPGAGDAAVLWTLQREPSQRAEWRLARVTAFTADPPS